MKRIIFISLFIAATAWALPTQKINVTGSASLNVLKAGDTMTGALVNSVNSAASTPALSLTGTPFTGGSATTTKPHLLIEPAATTSTAWNTSGTMLGVNGPTGFAGLLSDWQLSGTSKASIASDGTISGNAVQTGQIFSASNNSTVQVGLTRSYSNAGTTAVAIGNNTHSQSSGSNIAVSILPTINSSSTAANTDLLINRTQTATGSGAQNLIDAQVGGSSKFKVDNTGLVTTAVAIPATSGGTAQTTYATGDMIYASASNTLSKLTLGTAASGKALRVSATGIPAAEERSNPSRYGRSVNEDFTGYLSCGGSGGITQEGLHCQGSGTGAQVVFTSTNASNAHQGIATLETGTTTTGVTWVDDNVGGTLARYVGGGKLRYESIFLVSALSDGTNTYGIVSGLCATPSTSTCANGAYFSYIHSANSGQFVVYTSASSSHTTTNTSVALSTTLFHRLEIEVNAAASSVEFKIDGVSVATHTTNIPATSTALRGITFIQKSAGTTNRIVYLDAIGISTDYTTAR